MVPTVRFMGHVIVGGSVSGRHGPTTVAEVIELLLFGLGSMPWWLIVAVFVRIVPAATLELTWKTNVKVSDSKTNIIKFVQVTVPPLPTEGPVHDHAPGVPAVCPAETKVVPAGNVSVTLTLGAPEVRGWRPSACR